MQKVLKLMSMAKEFVHMFKLLNEQESEAVLKSKHFVYYTRSASIANVSGFVILSILLLMGSAPAWLATAVTYIEVGLAVELIVNVIIGYRTNCVTSGLLVVSILTNIAFFIMTYLTDTLILNEVLILK